MNFMWDMAIRAGEQGRPEQELFFCQAKEYSPFFEPAFPCLNETKARRYCSPASIPAKSPAAPRKKLPSKSSSCIFLIETSLLVRPSLKSVYKMACIYIGMEGTETEKSRFRFVETMFLPVGYELKVFWKYHFGIVGIEGTMRLGETALYE